MSDRVGQDWNPTSDTVLHDQRAAYDQMRERCPVAHSDLLGWSLFRHEDVVRVLNDTDTFSSVVSSHLSVPNGMDPPEHTGYRRVIEPYFRPERMAAFKPQCRTIAADLVESLLGRDDIELISDFALLFAVRVQCAFLGWPADMHEVLRLWVQRNHAATRAQDRSAMARVAQEFDGYVGDLLKVRRAAGAPAGDDVTTRLLQERVLDRPLRDEEIVSILRNWTVGEVGTISAAVGILVHYLCGDVDLQQQLRAQPSLLPDAIDEILRIHGPLLANRRIATCAVDIGGRKIDAGERLSLNWISANRDGRVFDEPGEFRLDRNPAANLLYGAGIHVCPGAPLARMELCVVLEELLARASRIEPIADRPASAAVAPASGLSTLPVRIR